MHIDCIEIGAGEDGTWGEGRLREGKSVLFIEPHPAALSSLWSRLNGYQHASFMCGAVSYNGRIEKFCSHENIDGIDHGTCLYGNFQSSRFPSFFWVFTCCFKQLLDHFTPTEVRMDTEGEELYIFTKYNFEFCPNILHVEFHAFSDIDKKNMAISHDKILNHGYKHIDTDRCNDSIVEHTYKLEGIQ